MKKRFRKRPQGLSQLLSPAVLLLFAFCVKVSVLRRYDTVQTRPHMSCMMALPNDKAGVDVDATDAISSSAH